MFVSKQFKMSSLVTYAALAIVAAPAVATSLAAQTARSSAPLAQAPNGMPSWTRFVKPSDAELKKRLTPLQYAVTQHDETETPFRNELWNNHEAGIYVDVVSGEPLFSSIDKYESGTGWPSFTRPLVAANIKTISDNTLGMVRTEVRSKHANSHLGHLFDDGPKPTGMRYCMNSASMRFIPVSKLVEEGYPEYVKLFAKSK